jgi:taurine transport system permease protein
VAGGLAIWQLTAMSGLVDPRILPAPILILHDFFFDVAINGYGGASLWQSVLISAWRLFLGIAFGSFGGILIGCATGVSPAARGIFEPTFEFFRCIPALGILALMVAWFGIGETSKVVMLTVGAMTPMVLTTAHGVRTARLERTQGAQSLGLGGLRLLWYVVLPSALPEILTGLRIGFGYAFGGLVAAEMIGASSGMGWMIWEASQYGETSIVFICLIIIGFMGFSADLGLQMLRQKLVPWAGRA